MMDFLCPIEILVLKMLKLSKIPGFFQSFSNSRLFLPKLSNSRFFQVKWQPCSGLQFVSILNKLFLKIILFFFKIYSTTIFKTISFQTYFNNSLVLE